MAEKVISGARTRKAAWKNCFMKAWESVRSPSGYRGQSRLSFNKSKRWIYTNGKATLSAAAPSLDLEAVCVSSARLTEAAALYARIVNKRRHVDVGPV